MRKKSLVIGAFLMFFTGAVAKAEEARESDLTVRQVILLGVPDGAEIAVNEFVWAVDQEKHVEVLTVIRRDAVDVIEILGEKIFGFARIAVIPKPEGEFGFLPTLAGVSDENDFLRVMSASFLYEDMEEAVLNQVQQEIISGVKEALKLLGITTDRELAGFIRKNFTKATFAS